MHIHLSGINSALFSLTVFLKNLLFFAFARLHYSNFFSVSARVQKCIFGLFDITIDGYLEYILQHSQRLRPTATRHQWNVGGIWKRNITAVITGKLYTFVPLVRVMESIFRALEVA